MSQKDLNLSFLQQNIKYKNSFAFHDENDSENIFSYGYSAPVLLKNGIPAIHLITSEDGGLMTVIAEKPIGIEDQLKEAIADKFGLDVSKIELKLIQTETALFVDFPEEIDPEVHVIPIEDSRMETTHIESETLVDSFEGEQEKTSLLANTTFQILCGVTSSLEADWTEVLRKAFYDGVKTECECVKFLNKEIDEGEIDLKEEFVNQPSKDLKESVRENLVDLAALKIVKTLQNITSPSQLPDKYNIDVSYSNSIPQKYIVKNSTDLANVYQDIPIEKIVSKSPKPLPSPTRKKPHGPTEKKECRISLGFNAPEYHITGIEINWAGQDQKMQWPNFPAVTMETDQSDPGDLTVKTTFADYSTYTSSIPYSKEVVIDLSNIGYTTVQITADSIEDKFKDISFSASYMPDDNSAKRQNFTVSFPKSSKWEAQWEVKTLSTDLNGTINYSWYGTLDTFWGKTYRSPKLSTDQNIITLKYE